MPAALRFLAVDLQTELTRIELFQLGIVNVAPAPDQPDAHHGRALLRADDARPAGRPAVSRFAGFESADPAAHGGGRPSPDRRHWVIRPLDLLVLGFDLVGLRVVPGEGEAAGAARQGRYAARLTSWSGSRPSTSLERAYYTTKDPDGKPM